MTRYFYEERMGSSRRKVGFTCPSCGEHIGPRVGEVVQLGRVKVDTSTREVWLDGQYFEERGREKLGKGKEITILIEMMRAPGLKFSVERLMDITDTWEADPHVIAVFISQLRRAFGDYLEFRNYKPTYGTGRRDGGYSLHPREEIVA